MTLMESMIALFRVDAQARALRHRVDSAQRYFNAQTRQLNELKAEQEELLSRKRQTQATLGNHENEAAALDERIEKLRGELNSTTTNKQYTAVLTEINSLKEQRGELDEKMLVEMSRVEAIDAELDGLNAKIEEREATRNVAEAQLKERQDEVGERLAELETEREQAAAALPGRELELFEELSDQFDGEAMAPLDEIDRRRKEYACGECNMQMPFESVSVLLNANDTLVQCTACGRILYMQDEIRGALAKR